MNLIRVVDQQHECRLGADIGRVLCEATVGSCRDRYPTAQLLPQMTVKAGWCRVARPTSTGDDSAVVAHRVLPVATLLVLDDRVATQRLVPVRPLVAKEASFQGRAVGLGEPTDYRPGRGCRRGARVQDRDEQPQNTR